MGQEVYILRTPRRLFKGLEKLSREDACKITAKLQPRYTGPYVVTKKYNPVLYDVEVTPGVMKRCHALRMKPK